MSSKTLLLQNRPFLSWGRQLTQVVMCNGHRKTRSSAIANRPVRRSVSVEMLAYGSTNNTNRLA